MDIIEPRLLTGQALAYTRSELIALGVASRSIRRELYRAPELRLSRGIYAAANLPEGSEYAGLLQALAGAGPYTVSYETAGILWGLLDRPLEPPFHLTAGPGGPRIRRPGTVVAHRSKIPAEFLRTVGGLQITNPAWTWLDLALGLPVSEALVLADRVIYVPRGRGRALATQKDLHAALAARGPARGVRNAREAAWLSRVGADSPPESRLRYYCHLRGLPEVSVNPLIGDQHGEAFFRPDLAFLEFKVAVQYEGQLFHSTPERVLKDVRRQEVTEALGWVEVRITKEHMRNGGSAAIRKIRAKLIERGWNSGAG